MIGRKLSKKLMVWWMKKEKKKEVDVIGQHAPFFNFLLDEVEQASLPSLPTSLPGRTNDP